MVKKTFVVLITIVGCVLIGALVLNILLPNVAASMINTVESMIYSATGISMDFNGDGQRGQTTKDPDNAGASDDSFDDGAAVDGWN